MHPKATRGWTGTSGGDVEAAGSILGHYHLVGVLRVDVRDGRVLQGEDQNEHRQPSSRQTRFPLSGLTELGGKMTCGHTHTNTDVKTSVRKIPEIHIPAWVTRILGNLTLL